MGTLDTRLAWIEGCLVLNPLERNLGFYEFRKYTITVPGDTNFTFEKIAGLWNEDITVDLNSDNEGEVESLKGNNSKVEEAEDTGTTQTANPG